MLSIFRRHSRSVFIKVLLLGVAASFIIGFGAFMYVGRYLSKTPKGTKSYVAKVGSQTITPESLNHYAEQMENYYKSVLKDNFDQLSPNMDFYMMALNELIDESIFEVEAQALGIEVSTAEIQRRILSNPAFWRRAKFDREQYIRILQRMGTNPQEFEEQEKRAIQMLKFKELLNSSIKISESEIHDEFLARNDKAGIEAILIKIEPNFEPDLSDADMEKYYNDHKAEFIIPEERKTDYLIFSPEKYLDKVVITDDQISKYYEDHKASDFTEQEKIKARHILIKSKPDDSEEKKAAAKKKAENVLEQAKKQGADFSELAKKYSEDEGSAAKGGDLGFFARTAVVKPFADAVFEAKPGEIVGPVSSVFGYHIILAEEKKPEKVMELSEVKDRIVGILKDEKAKEGAKEAAQKALADLKPGSNLIEYAKKQNIPFMSSLPFSKENPLKGLEKGKPATDMLMTLSKGEKSQVFEGSRSYYIFEVTNIWPEHQGEWQESEVKFLARDKVRKLKINQILMDRANRAIAALKGGAGIQSVAASIEGSDVKRTDLFTRAGPFIPGLGSNQELKEEIFKHTLSDPLIDKPYNIGNMIVVARLTQRESADESKYPDERNAIKQSIMQMKSNRFIDEWIEAKKKEFGVVYNEQFLSLDSEGKKQYSMKFKRSGRGRRPAQSRSPDVFD